MLGVARVVSLDSIDVARHKLNLQPRIMTNAASHLLSAAYAQLSGYNFQLTNAGGALLHLTACRSEWIHCTVSNLYNWDIISAPALTLMAHAPADTVAPEQQPRFFMANSIFTSRSTLMEPADVKGLPSTFDPCLLQVSG